MGRENVAEVGAIEDVFKSGEDADPDWWSPTAGNEPVDSALAAGRHNALDKSERLSWNCESHSQNTDWKD